MSEEVEFTCDNDEVIQDYGSPVHCLYGSKITVRDSSSAENVACWLRIDDSSWRFRADENGKRLGPKTKYDASAGHLNVEQAKAIVAHLQAWIDKAEEGDTPFGGLVEQ